MAGAERVATLISLSYAYLFLALGGHTMSEQKPVSIYVDESHRVVRIENNDEAEGYASVKLNPGERIDKYLWAIFVMNPHRFQLITV